MTSSSTSCADPRATWLEHWPAAVTALSFRQHGLALSRAELHALGRCNGIAAHHFEPQDGQVLPALASRLHQALRRYPGGAFVRLGSRSPKDSALFLRTGGRAQTGAEALALLTARSQRIYFDLRRCVLQGWRPRIYLRAWQDMHSTEEWRGFIEQGQVVGLCPCGPAALPGGQDTLRAALPPLLALGQRVARAWGPEPVVFDAWMAPTGNATLIELNPWGPPTDAVLFDWQQAFDGTLRAHTGAGILRLALDQDSSAGA